MWSLISTRKVCYSGKPQFLRAKLSTHMGSVGLEEDFHGTINSAERVGSGGGVAGLVDDVLGEGKAEEKDWHFSLEIQLVERLKFKFKDSTVWNN